MIKFFSVTALCMAGLFSAQISVSGRANLVFPTDKASWSNAKGTFQKAYNESGKNNIGFNAGISVKVDLPSNFFVMPEIYFTSFKNEYTDANTKSNVAVKYNRIDVPVLIGANVIGKILGIYVGPVASYNLSNNNNNSNFEEKASSALTVGYQLGAQTKILKLIVSARYEGAFNKDQREFIQKNITGDYTIKYDNRPNIFLLGLGYEF